LECVDHAAIARGIGAHVLRGPSVSVDWRQAGRQRVPPRVHAVAAFLAHRDVSRPGVLDQGLVQVVLLGERAHRGGVPQEHLRVVAGRPAGADVVDDRPADVFQQRNCTLRPVLAWAMDSRLPGQSKSVNSSRLMSMPRSPSLATSKMIA
jgi:hypothetical protein